MTLIDSRGNPLTEPAKAPPVMYSGASAVAAFENPVWRSSTNPSRLFRDLQALYKHPWIGLAERTINNKLVGLPWHLEDAEDEEVGDESPEALRAIWTLLEKPQAQLTGRAQMTRRDLWSITSRHLGLCGNSAWYLDNLDLLAETPSSILYLNPSRLTPATDKAGHLIGWLLDSSSYDSDDGVPLSLSEVLHFKLDPPDWGVWAIGVAESAWMKSRLSEIGDRHTANLLASGGRLAGMLMPKEGVTLEPDAWQSLIRDYRSITEDPQAAKRMQILKYPMDFTPTAANPEQIQLGELLRMSRDDIMALWGVPLTQVGIPAAAGIGANVRSFDEAVLMQGAVHARIVAMRETIQFQLLDRYMKLGITVELEIEEPSYDDRTPQFDLITKAVNAPLTVDQRLALLDEDPLDPSVYGTLGQAIYLPTSLARVDETTEEDADPEADLLADDFEDEEVDDLEADLLEPGKAAPKYVFGRLNPKYKGASGAVDKLSASENKARDAKVAKSPFFKAWQKSHPGATPREFRKAWVTAKRSGPKAFKALRSTLVKAFPAATRARVQKADRAVSVPKVVAKAPATRREALGEEIRPAMKRSVEGVLRSMRDEIAGWVKGHADHLSKKPKDTRWWNAGKWDKELLEALRPHASKIAAGIVSDVQGSLKPAGKADPGDFESTVRKLVLDKVGFRVTGMNEYTKDRVVSIIGETVEAGINQGLSMADLGTKLEEALDDAKVFDEYRAELIARTETGTVLNEAAVSSYREFGVEQVRVLDGDGDELCAPWDGWTGPISEAPDALGHPNCTRAFSPYFPELGKAKAEPVQVNVLPASLPRPPMRMHMERAENGWTFWEEPA